MPFVKGQSGNPAGRAPKGTTFREIIRDLPTKDKAALVKLALEKAMAGDVTWANWFLKASGETIAVEHSGKEGGAIPLALLKGILDADTDG